MPIVLVLGTAVHNDIAAVAASLAVILPWFQLAGAREVGRVGIVGVAGMLALTIKETALVALVVVAALEVRRQYLEHGPRRWARVVPPAVLVGFMPLISLVLLRRVDPLVRGSEPSNNAMEIAMSGDPRTFWNWVTDGTISATHSLQYSWGVFEGYWFQSIPQAVAIAAVGGLVAMVLRSPRTWQASAADAMRQGVLFFLAAMPIGSLAILRAAGGPLFFQARYLLPGMALAVLLLLVGAGRGWSRVALAATAVLWVATMREGLGLE